MPLRTARPAALTLLLTAAFAPLVLAGDARAAFDGARALRDVLQLAGAIGPRKTGTEGDRRAVDYVRREMEAAGLAVTLQPVERLLDEDGERSIGSWNVIGRLDGDAPDTILVAAHHDSHGVLVPGANDDASGLAVLLEAARATAARPRRLSYLFVSFCAEEEDLLGSRSYVRSTDLGRIRAVIALELLGNDGIFVAPAPKPPPSWAEKSVIRAARERGVTGIIARPIYVLVPRFIELPFTSDHVPFLEHGVPAFLLAGAAPAWTYHTPEDSVLHVRPESLERAGILLDGVLRDLETSAPPRDDDPHFLPLMAFGLGIVVSGPVLRGVAWAALLVAGFVVERRLRSILSFRTLAITLRVLIVAAASTGLGLSGLFASEKLMERITGTRFPWMAHQSLHLAQAILLMVVTGWLGLKLFRRIKPTVEPGPYLGAAVLLPITAVGTCLRLDRPELAAIAAVPLLAFLLSMLVQSVGRKLALGLLGALPLLLILTPADYRAAVDLGGIEIPTGPLIALLFGTALPFVLFLAHVASFQDCLHSTVWWWLSGPWLGGSLLVGWIVLLAVNALLPAYDAGQRQVVRVRQRIDLQARKATLMVHSSDTLGGVRLRGAGGRPIEGGGTTERLDLPFPADRVALDVDIGAVPRGPESEVLCTARLRAPRATDRISYLFRSNAGFRVPDRDQALRHSYTFTDVAVRTDPVRTFRFQVPDGGDLSLELRAEFAQDLLGIAPEGGARTFVEEGAIVASRRLLGGSAAAEAASSPPGGGGSPR